MAKLAKIRWKRLLIFLGIAAYLTGVNIFARCMDWRLLDPDLRDTGWQIAEIFIVSVFGTLAGTVTFFTICLLLVGIVGLVKWIREPLDENEDEELSYQQQRRKELREQLIAYHYWQQQKEVIPKVDWLDTRKCDWCETTDYLNERCTNCGAPAN